MKKILPYILAVIGLALVVYSIISPWTSWTQKFGAGISISKFGHEYWQGLAVGGLTLVGFAFYFFKSKLAILPCIVGAGIAMMVYFSPPMVEELQHEPTKAMFMAVAGTLLVGLGGLMVPAKKA